MRTSLLVGLVEVGHGARARRDYSTRAGAGKPAAGARIAAEASNPSGGHAVAQTSRLADARSAAFKPYVPDEAAAPRADPAGPASWARSSGIVFGASSVYLALRVGLTVSASVPIAVISITLFRALSQVLGRPRLDPREHAWCRPPARRGSRSRPAWPSRSRPSCCSASRWTGLRTLLLSLCGGMLGVLMMIPLRRYLIVKEHGDLTYPEGTACAEVLIAGEERGAQARLRLPGPLRRARSSSSLTAVDAALDRGARSPHLRATGRPRSPATSRRS